MDAEPSEIERAVAAHPAVRAATAAVCHGPDGERRVVVTVVPECAAPDGDALAVLHWQQRYDQAYARVGTDPDAQAAMWVDPFTGKPFTREVIDDLVSCAAARIRNLQPRKVLDIGCGLGHIALAVAPDCEHYVGTDFSVAALDVLRRRLDATDLPPDRVALLHREANDLRGLPASSFDVIVLNGVLQHFPSLSYALDVLHAVLDVAAPGARIFVGDVPDLELLEAMYLSLEEAWAGPDLRAGELRRRIERRTAAEKQLIPSRHFFAALPGTLPRITGAELRLKRGRHADGISRFRHDVLLTLDGPTPESGSCLVLDWTSDVKELGRLGDLVRTVGGRAVEVRDVPNACVYDLGERLRYLRDLDDDATWPPPTDHVGPVRAVDPENVWSLAVAAQRVAEVVAAGSGHPFRMDLRFWPSGDRGDPRRWSAPSTVAAAREKLSNEPMAAVWQAELVNDLSEHLRARLPELRMPAFEFVLT